MDAVSNGSTFRARVLAGFVLAGALVLVSAGPVRAAEKPTEVSKCVDEAAKSGKQASECVKSPNPILPATSELVWGSISFVVLLGVMWKFAYPGVKKGMEARAAKIKSSLDEAESTRSEAQEILDDYRRQLADAKSEGARIIEEARQAADKLRQDLKRQAESEVADIKSRAQEDISAQVERAKAELQARVATLSVDLAEKVVERSLDRQTSLALVESFIRQTEASN
ncbi:MAG: F-type H+-transporting ATPase subunit b [Acidimicrobiaceae bacterium]